MLPATMSQSRSLTSLLALLIVPLGFWICGCGDETKYEHVSYDPPKIEHPETGIKVPDGQAGAPPGDAATFTAPAAVKPNGLVVFTGRFRPKAAGKGGPVLASFIAIGDDRHRRTVYQTAFGVSTEEKDGFWSYRVQISAPEQPREYEVELMHLEDLVATGKVNVK